MKPRLLDLYAGAGGAAQGYANAGFEVVGVDIAPQPNYPFEFIQRDALDFFEQLWGDDTYDAIHASPPCQFVSAVTPDKSIHLNLIAPTRERIEQTGLPYVIENVERAAPWLREAIRICGSGLNLDVQRHRLFECNFPAMGVPCAHNRPAKFDVYEHGHWYKTPFAKVYGSGGGKAMEHWAEAMRIDWMTPDEMVEAIPPAYTEHVGLYLKAEVEARQKAAA